MNAYEANPIHWCLNCERWRPDKDFTYNWDDEDARPRLCTACRKAGLRPTVALQARRLTAIAYNVRRYNAKQQPQPG